MCVCVCVCTPTHTKWQRPVADRISGSFYGLYMDIGKQDIYSTSTVESVHRYFLHYLIDYIEEGRIHNTVPINFLLIIFTEYNKRWPPPSRIRGIRGYG